MSGSDKKNSPDPAGICFGLSPELDRQSCATYLQLLGKADLARILSERLSPQEIEDLITLVTTLLQTHLSKREYHTLFLGQENIRYHPEK